MRAALTLCDYYTNHAERVQSTFGGTPEPRMISRTLRWVKQTDSKTFTERDLYRALGVKKDVIIEPLKLLEEYGYIRLVIKACEDLQGKSGRKPSTMWEVNPSLRRDSVKSVNSVLGVCS